MTTNNGSLKGLALVMTVCMLTAPLAAFLFAVPLDVAGDPPFSDNELVNVVNSESQRAPSIAVDSGGNIYIAWEDLRSTSDWDIYFANSTDGGTTWSNPNVKINSDLSATDQNKPVIAVDPSGTIFAAWEDYRGGGADIYFANSTDGGATWSNPNVIINTDGIPLVEQYAPALAANSSNEVYCVWQDARSGSDWDIYFSRSTDGGKVWMDPNIMVNNAPVSTDQQIPTIAVDDNGDIYVAWEDNRDGGSSIYFSKSTDGGNIWSLDVKVNNDPSSNQSYDPTITVDSSGNIYLAWMDLRGGHADIYYAISMDGGLTWSDPNIKINNDATTENQRAPSIAVNSTGAIFVAWEDFRWGDFDIYFAVSEDMGATWSDPNLRVNDDTGSTNQEKPSMVAGPDGLAYIAWQDYRSTDNFDIYFAHLTPPPPPPTVDYIEITILPGGAPLAGGIVPTGHTEWGHCSAYNNSQGYLFTVSADWTAQGGTASLLGPTPELTNGIDVGSTEVVVWLNASYGIYTDSVQYTVIDYTVDYIDITDAPDGASLTGGSVPVGFSEWGNCSAYNNSGGYLYTVSADWTALGGTSILLGATPADMNGINVGDVQGTVWLNASYGIHTDSVVYDVLSPTVDYIVITDIPDGISLAGGSVPVGFTEPGTCSAYNDTSGYITTVSADWTAEGGTALLLGATPGITNGIDVGTSAGAVWLNASYGGLSDSVQYDVLPPTPDYIEITETPGGTPLSGGTVTVGFTQWGNCSVYNLTSGYITTVSANWTAEGGSASLLGATPAVLNGINVGATTVSVYLNASFGGFMDSVEYDVSGLTVDFIEITDFPDGTPLAGGNVPVGLAQWGNCSAYNNSGGFIGVVNAGWSTEGGTAWLLGLTPALFNGINVGTAAGYVWLNASYGGHTASVQYQVNPPTVDHIEITDIPGGTPLAGGTVLDNFVVWANCSAYNLTSGHIAAVSANWTADGGTATLLGATPGVMNGIDVGDSAGEVWFNVSYGGYEDSVMYTVTPPTVDYIEITDVPDGIPLAGGIVPLDFSEWGNCSSYNNTAGYLDTVSAEWTAEGGTAALLGATPAVMNGIEVGNSPGDVWLNASYGGFFTSVHYTLSALFVDYIEISDVPDGTPLSGGAVALGFTQWGNCSAYNYTGGYIGLVSAHWSVEGGTASLLGATPALFNGIHVGTASGPVWLNASYNGLSAAVQYTVNPPTVDYIDITDIPGGIPLAGGNVPVGFKARGNCSTYNNTIGYIDVAEAQWTVQGGAATLTDAVPAVFNGINVGNLGGTVWLNATYGGFADSVQFTVSPPTVDIIIIRTAPDGEGDVLETESFDVGDTATYHAAGYNATVGYVSDVPGAQWTVSGGIGSVSSPGASTTFTATDPGTGTIIVTFDSITNQSGVVTVEDVADTTPPAAPGQPTIEVTGKSSIRISWPPNSEADLDGYRIYRRTSPDDDWTLVGNTDKATLSFWDTDLKSGTKYYYSVTAIDDAATPNESPHSQVASGTTEKDEDTSMLPFLIIIIIVIIVLIVILVLVKRKPREEVPTDGEALVPEEEPVVEGSEIEEEDEEPGDYESDEESVEYGGSVEEKPGIEEDFDESEGYHEEEESESADSDGTEEVK